MARGPLRDAARARVSALKIVAMVSAEKLLDAEKAASDLPPTIPPDVRLDLARDLDRVASASASDRVSRRAGGIEALIADRLGDRVPPKRVTEARLRRARGRLLSGDRDGARAVLNDPKPLSPEALGPEDLADLADLQLKSGEPAEAAESYRKLAHRAESGSPLWFLARLGQAAALGKEGRKDPARRLIEGTELLHPGLGGAAMKARFSALKKALDRP